MSTQEETVPKRRSSRGATAKSRSGAARRRAAEQQAAPAVGEARAEATTEAAVSRKAPVTVSKKERAQKEAPAKNRFLATERFDGIKRFSRETYAEIKKVNWPDQQTTRNLTIVVIAVSAALGILLGGIDFALLKIFEAMP